VAVGVVEQLADGRVVGQIEGEALECLLDGFLAVVVDDANAAVVGILQDEALEQVVDVADAEGHVHALIAFDGALALEVADAGAEQDDMRQWQRRLGRAVRGAGDEASRRISGGRLDGNDRGGTEGSNGAENEVRATHGSRISKGQGMPNGCLFPCADVSNQNDRWCDPCAREGAIFLESEARGNSEGVLADGTLPKGVNLFE